MRAVGGAVHAEDVACVGTVGTRDNARKTHRRNLVHPPRRYRLANKKIVVCMPLGTRHTNSN